MVASIKVSWTYGSHNRLTHILYLQFSKLRLSHSLSSIVKIVYLFRAAQVLSASFNFLYMTYLWYSIILQYKHSFITQSIHTVIYANKMATNLNQAKNIFEVVCNTLQQLDVTLCKRWLITDRHVFSPSPPTRSEGIKKLSWYETT